MYTSLTKLPDKKRYLELVTALLSVPVLATAILLNFNNLKPKVEPTPTPTVQEKIVYVSPSKSDEPTPTECKEGIAPLEVSSPKEDETVSDNPVNIDINYTQGEYCAAVWSYRLNNGRWSDYSDRSIALYNLPQGNIVFDLRVKSIVTSQEKTYSRSFIYAGTEISNTPTSTPSAE